MGLILRICAHLLLCRWWADLWEFVPIAVVLQCVAVWCSVVQCGAVCCSVLLSMGLGTYIYVYIAVNGLTFENVCLLLWGLTFGLGIYIYYIYVCCSVLQCAAVCCSVLQCAAVFCSVLQCVAVCCSMLLFIGLGIYIYVYITSNELTFWECVLIAVVLQSVAVHCSVLQCVAVCCFLWVLGHIYICTSLVMSWHLRICAHRCSVAVCCSALQCVAVCCFWWVLEIYICVHRW